MVDHIRTLLINPDSTAGYRKVSDSPSDSVMQLFGVAGDCNDASVVDSFLPLVFADDLSSFREPFDQRVTPTSTVQSVYRHSYTACGSDGTTCTSVSLDSLYDKVLGTEGWFTTSSLFSTDNQVASSLLTEMREAARSMDAPYALGAVLLACAYRRLLLQEGSV